MSLRCPVAAAGVELLEEADHAGGAELSLQRGEAGGADLFRRSAVNHVRASSLALYGVGFQSRAVGTRDGGSRHEENRGGAEFPGGTPVPPLFTSPASAAR